MRKKLCLTLLLLALVVTALPAAALAAVPEAAAPAQKPVTLAPNGKSFTYGDVTVELGPHALFLDGRLSDSDIAGLEYVYNSFNEAIKHLTDGTKEEPTTLYIAPNVYWIHDPKAESTEGVEMFSADTQLHIDCEELHIVGLTEDARNVVIAANFGHDLGLMGANYTMIYAEGDGLTLKNLTFGDYCNVDLVYPLDPSKNVPARSPGNITQGQIASCNGDRLYAENVRFVSRLNMMPFNNSQRALYVDCHMESTDDSLNGSPLAVYLNCDFEFYSSKPWYSSSGAVVLNSTFNIKHQVRAGMTAQEFAQYLTKVTDAGTVTVIDSKFVSDFGDATVNIGFNDVVAADYRSLYANVTHNGKAVDFSNGGAAPDAGVDLTGTDALKAFRFTDSEGKTVYNIYNLLSGDDGWDPLGLKAAAEAADAADLPTFMTASVSSGTSVIESGNAEAEADLSFNITGPRATDYNAGAKVTWSVPAGDEKYVALTPSADGKTCHVTGVNNTDETVTVVVTAKDASGLQAAVALTVRPSVLPSPVFETAPAVTQNPDGTASVSYTYTAESMGGRADLSRVDWYLSEDGKLEGAVKIAEDRQDAPLSSIRIDEAYIGKYLIAAVEPRNIRTEYGEAVTAVSARITAEGVKALDGRLTVDIPSFPTDTQKAILPGLWTVDSYRPADTAKGAPLNGGWGDADADGESKVVYGKGLTGNFTGHEGVLMETDRGGRLMYTPLHSAAGDMSLTAVLVPGKTAGQGFGSANQYMELMIKYDTSSHTGYGLKIYRKTGSTCSFVLVKHASDGSITFISDEVESDIFRAVETVKVWTVGDKLCASVTSSGIEGSVELSADVAGLGDFAGSGVCLQHTGTYGTNGANSILITGLDIAWTPKADKPVEPDQPDTPPAEVPATYTVQKGDTLMKIAKKVYGDSKYWNQIYFANQDKIKATNKIYVGQVFTLPVIPGAPAPTGSTPAPGTPSVPTGKTYTVQKGDTLSAIALKLYGQASQWKKLYEANKDIIKDPNLIYAGQILKIPE